MAAKNNTLQDGFLAALEGQAVPATVFLINGVKLQGHVVRHDLFSLALRRAGQTQLVLKSSISTIIPSGEFDL
ncbi:RNA-binding protein Hfq [Roseovarius sp. A-2]|uniref:RNA chaperone Hfq n=1 Tax=Roseovarius sp. A-2 TaxID=1570360 RepID=UPI0009B52CD4|nr:RNA chaperone Hfq [Roseovarius sp. A-2]GAW37153.1 RNA-binding protein Hfq [Roseovarius sp. A-2]